MIQLAIPVTYNIIDLNGEEIEWSFYEQELQKTTHDIFGIEKVLKRKGDKSLVKWVGCSDTFSSWVDNKAIVGKLYYYITLNKMLYIHSKLN